MSFFQVLPLLWLAAATPAAVPETRAIAVFSDRSVRWLSPGEIEDAADLSGFVACRGNRYQVDPVLPGTEVDRNGAVLPGATFDLMDASPELRQQQRTLARFAANEDGEVRIESLPDAASVLWVVTEPSHSPVGFRSRPSSLPSRIVLGPGATVRGVFTDPRGAAIPGVRVAR